MLVRRRINYVAPMLASAAILLLLLSGYFELPSISSLTAAATAGVPGSLFPTALDSVGSRDPAAFTSLLAALRDWDAAVDRPDALLFEGATPPQQRMKGLPLRVYLDLEAARRPTGFEDIFIGYHAQDDVQVTYAGKSFHTSRSYHVSTEKRNDALIYWSSSRCLPHRDKLAKEFLSMVPHHSFGRCLNNVGGHDKVLSMYPVCSSDDNVAPHHWWDHLHCTMSHYKFVLAIENTKTESYVTEKLFYALEAGSVPVYFGAPNVWDLVPPNSIIDASRFSSLKELASYVKTLANDPVAYAEYHAWRRCGIFGNFGRTREMSLDTLPCRLCELVSKRGGRSADAL